MVPSFYDPNKVGTVYAPRIDEAIQAGMRTSAKPAKEDQFRTALLLIDAQVDFVHTDGALSVPGAVQDTQRTIEWIFSRVANITTIFASLDSHIPNQIFSPSWWIDQNGNSPAPFTMISHDDVMSGKWTALYQPKWSAQYVNKLSIQAKKQLMIWPYHTLIGTIGHSITPALYEAIIYHSAVRRTQPNFVMKGTVPEVEHYSIFEPEVKLPTAEGGLNKPLLDTICSYDRIYVAGQAKSHCVLESVTSIMNYFADRPEIIGKITLLKDAMSSVVSPGVDFDGLANEAYARFAQQGLKIKTTIEL